MITLVKRYGAHYKLGILLNIVLVCLQAYLQTVLVMGQMKRIIENGVKQGNMEYVFHCGALMLVYTLLAGAVIVLQSYVSGRLVAGMTRRLREDCFQKILAMSKQDFDKFGAATLLNRTVSGVSQIEVLLLNLLRNALLIPIVIVFMSIMLFTINWVLAVAFLAAFVLTAILLVALGGRSRRYFLQNQKALDHLNLLTSEALTGTRPIRAFCNQSLEEEKLGAANQEIYDTALRANKTINFLGPASMVIMKWAIVLMYFAGSMQLRAQMTSISGLLLAFTYMGYFVTCLSVIPFLVNLIPNASVAAERLLEILDYRNGDQRNGSKKEGVKAGEVRFEDVVFGYNGARNVIDHVSFTAAPGKTTAIVGATGSGKTTLLNLLTRLYALNGGAILVDGTDIREYDADYLRSRISYGTQQAMVFHTTVRNNLTAFSDAVGEERIRQGCDAAAFTEVLDLLPQGLDTVMAQDGKNISGGQRQRLSLARTLTKEADIYLLDDTFSALDAVTSAAALEGSAQMLQGKTVIMVAQKLASIRTADHIVVMDNGRVAGEGTHEELLASCREYQEIYKTQCYQEAAG